MLLFGKRHWAPHRPWLVIFLAVSAAAGLWFWLASRGSAQLPGGSSAVGFTCGVVGGLICLFEFALWIKKRVRVWRIGSAQAWLRAHVWLGLLTVPLLFLHSGFRFGGTLATWLMIVLLIVVASGIWGLVMQQRLPKKMLDQVPAETIYSQIDRLAEQIHREAREVVLSVCGPEHLATAAGGPERDKLDVGFVVVGALRQAGAFQGKAVGTRPVYSQVPGAEVLSRFFAEVAGPFLLKATASSPLADGPRSRTLFQNLRTQLPPQAHGAVETLEDYCEQRRQWETQRRLHFWLHNWLWIHFPLSLALLVLMVVHIVLALMYY